MAAALARVASGAGMPRIVRIVGVPDRHAAPTPTAIDAGTYITNMQVIFQGTRQTHECLFSRWGACSTTTKLARPPGV